MISPAIASATLTAEPAINQHTLRTRFYPVVVGVGGGLLELVAQSSGPATRGIGYWERAGNPDLFNWVELMNTDPKRIQIHNNTDKNNVTPDFSQFFINNL